MIYDKLTVALLSMLSAEDRQSVNAQIARYLLGRVGETGELSVKEIAAACHVGVGTVSRFARDTGFENFAELREAFGSFARPQVVCEGDGVTDRASTLADRIGEAVGQAASSLDEAALSRLVGDLARYEKVSAFGLLKGQAAALDLQVDLLMQGKWVDTCTALSEQMARIASAGRDELVIVFSYTGAYFEYGDLTEAMRRLDRPKIWMVCGARRPQPDYVSDMLAFGSSLGLAGHPHQLEMVAGVIAQEYAASRA